MPIALADLKAVCAEYDATVLTNRFVPRGQMFVMDLAATGMSDLQPGRRVVAIHPDDAPPDHAGYAALRRTMADLEIVSRGTWGAREPRSRKTIPEPTPELWLHHSDSNGVGAEGVRGIQNFHMDSRKWADVAYSFIVCRVSLEVFEGRGHGIRGGHTFGHNTKSHGICVMGKFHPYKPADTHPMLTARIAELVDHGHSRGWWPAELTGGHREVRATSCPGDYLQQRIPDINRLATEGTTVILASDKVKAAQIAMNSVGYQPKLDDDGKFGDLTQAAIEWFVGEYTRLTGIETELTKGIHEANEARNLARDAAQEWKERHDALKEHGADVQTMADAQNWRRHVMTVRALLLATGLVPELEQQ